MVHGNNFTLKRSTAKLSWIRTRPCWNRNRKQLVGAGWVQTLKKKIIAEQHTCTYGKPRKLDGPFHWQNRLSRFHPLFYILVCVSSSCGKDGAYSSKLAWNSTLAQLTLSTTSLQLTCCFSTVSFSFFSSLPFLSYSVPPPYILLLIMFSYFNRGVAWQACFCFSANLDK